eukprot:TRINITY_DN3735_c0_g3_i3.p1 TRINITY_DN3735_c0_g3~~TRINITY_DN3735_c0_g3_i3.p1  ORF type:complete len:298 (-),score=41.08 TRINITY_DN3735_c0_g3_i3:1113-1892(-)
MEQDHSQCKFDNPCNVIAIFHELILPISQFLDVRSLSRFFRVSRLLSSLSLSQILWKKVVEKTYFGKEVAALPRNFNYCTYFREKMIWSYPLAWERVEPLVRPSPRTRHGVTVVDDKIVLIGGHMKDFADFERQQDIWVFDTKTDSFHQVQPLPGFEPPRISRHCLHAFGDQIYSFGGILQNKQKLNSVFSFDLNSRQWKVVSVRGIPPSPRCDPITCNYRRGILVFGGSLEGLIFPSDLYYFNIGTMLLLPDALYIVH